MSGNTDFARADDGRRGQLGAAPGTDLLSIVIINHNYGRYLRDAIESALAQKWSRTEIIVVDDGSEDNSRSVLEPYLACLVAVHHDVAQGHVAAVNAGFAAARGQFLIFLDADDKLYPDCAETVLSAWQTGDVKLQFRLDTIDTDGNDCHMPFPYFPSDLTPGAIQLQSARYGTYPWTVSSGNAYRRDYLQQLLPIDTRVIFRSPDGYLNKLAPLFGQVRSLQAVLGAYRVHGDNAWAQEAGAFRVEPVLRWLAFDRALEAAFDHAAHLRGIAVSGEAERKTLQHMEYRLLGQRFAADKTPYPLDTRAGLWLRGFRIACNAPNVSALGRLAWIVWLAALAGLPKRSLRLILLLSRSQSRRSRLARGVLRLSRGPALTSQIGRD